jgi:hypothetical protein
VVLAEAELGVVVVDPAAAASCIASLRDSCERTDASSGLDFASNRACRAVLHLCTPRAIGEACDQRWQCAPGLTCGVGPACYETACCSEEPTCQRPAAPGEPCDTRGCYSDDADWASCVDSSGRPGADCVAFTLSLTRAGVGDLCGAYLSASDGRAIATRCEAGLYCMKPFPDVPGVCRTLMAEGGSCADTACGPGLVCDRDTCVAALGPDPIGGPCGYFCQIQGGSTCAIVDGPDGPTAGCVATDGSLGSACLLSECQDGLYCDAMHCAEAFASGATCRRNAECASRCCDGGICG